MGLTPRPGRCALADAGSGCVWRSSLDGSPSREVRRSGCQRGILGGKESAPHTTQLCRCGQIEKTGPAVVRGFPTTNAIPMIHPFVPSPITRTVRHHCTAPPEHHRRRIGPDHPGARSSDLPILVIALCRPRCSDNTTAAFGTPSAKTAAVPPSHPPPSRPIAQFRPFPRYPHSRPSLPGCGIARPNNRSALSRHSEPPSRPRSSTLIGPRTGLASDNRGRHASPCI